MQFTPEEAYVFDVRSSHNVATIQTLKLGEAGVPLKILMVPSSDLSADAVTATANIELLDGAPHIVTSIEGNDAPMQLPLDQVDSVIESLKAKLATLTR